MPSFLHKSEFVPIQPYAHPMELQAKALMYRDNKVKEGLQSIRSKYDSILSYQLTNPENQEFVRNELKSALGRLDSLSGADLSLPENVGMAMSTFDPITSDRKLLEDISFTRHMAGEKAKIESLQTSHPDLVTPQNILPVLEAENNYRNARVRTGQSGSPEFAKFEPYYNFEKTHNEFLTKIKADIDQQFSDIHYEIDMPDGSKKTVGMLTVQEKEELSKYKVRQALMSEFNSDPKAMRQMMLDHQYNTKMELYNPEELMTRLKGETDSWDVKIKQMQSQVAQAKAMGVLSPEQEAQASVAGNPSAYQFTMGDLVDSYVTKQENRWSYSQKKKLDLAPGQTEVFKFTTESWLKQLQASLDIATEKAKSQIKIEFDAADRWINSDGTPADRVWLYEVSEAVETRGSYSTEQNDPSLRALAGDVDPKDDKITINVDSAGLEGTGIIVKPAVLGDNVEATKGYTFLTALNKGVQDIAKINNKEFQTEVKHVQGKSDIPYSTWKSMSSSEKANKLFKLYKDYKANPKSFKYTSSMDLIVPTLEGMGITASSTEVDFTKKYSDALTHTNLSEDQVSTIVDAGIKLSEKIHGKFEFIPATKDQVKGLDNGKLGVDGWLLMPKTVAASNKIPVAEMQAAGLLKNTFNEEQLSYLKSDNTTDYKDWVAIKIIKPVDGNNQQILEATQKARTTLTGQDADKYLKRSQKFWTEYESSKANWADLVHTAKSNIGKQLEEGKITAEEAEKKLNQVRQFDENNNKGLSRYQKAWNLKTLQGLTLGGASVKAIEFLKRDDIEGFYEKAYPDGGRYSIGYGTYATSRDQKITKEEAEQALQQEVTQATQQVDAAVKAPLVDEQKAALISLTYNAGFGISQRVINLINSGASEDEIKKVWLNLALTEKGAHHKGPILKSRREKEVALYFGK
jgi:lysozyme